MLILKIATRLGIPGEVVTSGEIRGASRADIGG